MKVSYLSQAFICALVLMLFTGMTFAAKKKDETLNPYPNATRNEPKLEMSERNQKDISKALDLINEGKADEAAPLVEKVLNDSKASKYARALALQAQGQIAYEKEN